MHMMMSIYGTAVGTGTGPAIFMDNVSLQVFMEHLKSPYLQYPQSPYGISTMALPGPSSSSPWLDFDLLNLANMIGKYSYLQWHLPPAVYNISVGELSLDSLSSGRHSHGSGTHSPASVHSMPYAATIPCSHHFNKITPPATHSATKSTCRKSCNKDSDNEDEEFQPAASNSGNNDACCETIHKQCIESEQRHCDELWVSYHQLKDALLVSNQRSSKVYLLNCATTHVKYLEMTAQQLQVRLQQAENEVQHFHVGVNRASMLGTAKQRHAAAAAAATAIAAMSQ
ncbi:hypothetical protein EDD16DRAFT_1690402 [Pisolithus croceorrhizus]|nr:hypothetical protein EDD16DRAFT_1690402 [Pisolithus croceorrhizus]